jgi:hypothetical protein
MFPVWLGFAAARGRDVVQRVRRAGAIAAALAGLVFVIAVWWTLRLAGLVGAAIVPRRWRTSGRRLASSPRRSCARRSSWSATVRIWRAFSAEPSGG